MTQILCLITHLWDSEEAVCTQGGSGHMPSGNSDNWLLDDSCQFGIHNKRVAVVHVQSVVYPKPAFKPMPCTQL